MPRGNRAIYIGFQLRARNRSPLKNIIIDWNRKILNQRNSIVTLINTAWGAQLAVDNRQPVAAARQQDANQLNLPTRDPGRLEDYLQACQSAIGECERLAEELLRADNAWDALELELRNQADHALAINLAMAYKNAARNSIPATQNQINQLKTLLETPPVIPRVGDGERVIRRKWATTRKCHTILSQAAQQFDDVVQAYQPGAGGWICRRELDSDETSFTHLWIDLDEYDMIRDRCVRREVSMRNEWFDARAWSGDVKNFVERDPWEIRCHQEMNSIPGIKHVVLPTDWNLSLLRQSYKLYIEWCPYGTVADLIEHYAHLPELDHIPEPMLWWVVESVTRCCRAMKKGRYRNYDRTANWVGWTHGIVHRGLQPRSIQLTYARPRRFRHYPDVRIGNFRFAVMTDETDANNPSFWQEVGTGGFMAPETISFVERNSLQDRSLIPISEKTDVFGLGLILYCMITLTNEPPRTLWLGDGNADTTFQLIGTTKRNVAQYSLDLKELVQECTRYNPHQRPSFKNIQGRLRRTERKFPGDANLPGHDGSDYHDSDSDCGDSDLNSPHESSEPTESFYSSDDDDDDNDAEYPYREENWFQGMHNDRVLPDIRFQHQLIGFPPGDTYQLGLAANQIQE